MARLKRGRFITFEGLDGCGKSTQLNLLATTLRAAGHDVIVTREPGGTPIGEQIRAVLLDSRTNGLRPLGELALMFASRAQLIAEVIQPALKAGKVVVCDRYTDSSEAYQGGGRQLGVKPVRALHAALCGGLQPDLTILLISDVNASVQRARRRNLRNLHAGDENRFEKETAAFFQRVLKSYLAIARRDPKRVVKIAAHQPIPDVQQKVMEAVRARLGLARG